jgi:hypothetical protein
MKRVYKWIVGGLEFSSLQKAKQFCRESGTGATGIYGADRNGNRITFTPIENTKRGISFGKSYKINVNNTL